MVAPLFWEQEEQFDSDILHHPVVVYWHCLKVGKQWGRLLKANQCSDNKERLLTSISFFKRQEGWASL